MDALDFRSPGKAAHSAAAHFGGTFTKYLTFIEGLPQVRCRAVEVHRIEGKNIILLH